VSPPVRLAAALAAALVLAPPARAEPRSGHLPASLALTGGRVSATVDLAAALDPALERRLANGLTNVVAVVLLVVPEEGGLPVAVAARVTEVVFDVWDEDYTVTVRDPQAPVPLRRTVPDLAALRRLLADGGEVDLGPPRALPGGGFRLEARVEVNPVSRELMQRTRELLAHPGTAGRPGAASRSVLGAVAGYLLRDPGPSDDRVILRSRRIEPVEVGAP
jgi:hypothetical protein